MMRCRPALAAVLLLPLASCAHLDNKGRSYAGSPGSTYDAVLNPPHAHGVVTYDPSILAAPRDYGNSGDGHVSAAPGR